MTFCLNEGLILNNPILNIQLPRAQNVDETNAFTDEEVKRILSQPNLNKLSGRMHNSLLSVLFFTGFRLSEILNIKIKDISIERNHKVVKVTGKGNKQRIVPLTPFVQTAIEEYLQKSNKIFTDESYLFQTIKGSNNKPLHCNSIDYIIKYYSKKAGINKRISPHSCRATVISNLLENKVTIRDVAILVGHSNIQTTNTYDKRKENLDKSAAYQIRY